GIIERKEKKQINKLEKFSKDSEYELSVIGAAVFDKQRLVGYLNGIETKAYNIITGNVKTGIITFPTPTVSVDEISSLTLAIESDIDSQEPNKIHMSTIDIIKLKSKRDVEIVDGNILLKVDIRLRGSLEEFVGNMDISNERNMKEIEKACSQEIKNKLEDTLRKVQSEYETDIFGFGSVFHRKHPEEWHQIEDNWNEIFSKANIKVDVKTNVIRTGLINVPIGKTKGK
ncbi:Ger(x)C family spore germination C-terminal domain-containing protein, partial [Clostridium sp. Cult3]|uniref:Ger(x)C family spore germination C-terminal domain-containing protein n=1 Tax=Clostridium sp. Cult3 TaxID=2079004 RepID=UPI001F393704